MLKRGTRIELHGTPALGGFPAVAPETARIIRARKDIHVPGYYNVRFDNGGSLAVHESHFRIIDNRQ